MELKRISTLIDPRTRIAKTMTATGCDHRGKYRQVFSGYVAFVLDGTLIQRRLYVMPFNAEYDSCTFIIHKRVNYAVDLVCKPISGAFNAESLKV